MSGLTDNPGDEDEQPDVSVMRIAGHDYRGTTTVYTTGSGADVFHADKNCPHILKTSTSGYGFDAYVTAHSLPTVLSEYTPPIKPCKHCTLSMEDTVRVAVQQDGMDPLFLKYFEEGDQRVSEQWTRGSDGGWQLSSRSVTEVYDD